MHSSDDKLRTYLRRSTAVDHARAEEVHWNGAAFHDRPTYMTFLFALRSAHQNLGLPAAQSLYQPDELRRHMNCVSLLSSDLAGQTPNPGVQPVPDISHSKAWGITYALVGSALGAASILKWLTRAQPNWPHAYLRASHAFAVTGGVHAMFEALDKADVNRADCLDGARMVFRCIQTAQPAETIPQNPAIEHKKAS